MIKVIDGFMVLFFLSIFIFLFGNFGTDAQGLLLLISFLGANLLMFVLIFMRFIKGKDSVFKNYFLEFIKVVLVFVLNGAFSVIFGLIFGIASSFFLIKGNDTAAGFGTVMFVALASFVGFTLMNRFFIFKNKNSINLL